VLDLVTRVAGTLMQRVGVYDAEAYSSSFFFCRPKENS